MKKRELTIYFVANTDMGNNASSVQRKEWVSMGKKKIQDNIASADRAASEWAVRNQTTAFSNADVLDQMKIVGTARDQVRCGDKPLTKTDLTAILIRLQPGLRPDQACKIYSSLSTSDLIILIREIIYLQPMPENSGGSCLITV